MKDNSDKRINTGIGTYNSMHEVYRDKAGNRLLRDPLTGGMEARNAKGELVNAKGFETLAKRAGMEGHFVKGKKSKSAFSF